jgi:hypothetical protein
MAVTITDTIMRSDRTAHTADCAQSPPSGALAWQVTWLPGRNLTRNQAVTAMTLADAVGGGLEPGDRLWPFIDGWAEELGLTGPNAVVRASAEPAK